MRFFSSEHWEIQNGDFLMACRSHDVIKTTIWIDVGKHEINQRPKTRENITDKKIAFANTVILNPS